MQIEAKNIQYCCFILLEFEHDTQSEMFCVDEKNLFRPEIKKVVFFFFLCGKTSIEQLSIAFCTVTYPKQFDSDPNSFSK